VSRAVYFLGQMTAKKAASDEGVQNEGFDDKEGFYICKPHDHILFRYEIQELLGKGTFGQASCSATSLFYHCNTQEVFFKCISLVQGKNMMHV
jgi:hypothetical protein